MNFAILDKLLSQNQMPVKYMYMYIARISQNHTTQRLSSKSEKRKKDDMNFT